MAIQRVGGYVFSCAPCKAVYPARPTLGQARQDELDHHRPVENRVCDCLIIKDHQHHSAGCAWSRRIQAVAE